VARCIGLPPERLCRACLTGQYPTEMGEQLYQVALSNRNGTTGGRTYELTTPVAVAVPVPAKPC
jgi:amidophosphoribosyltransferase